MRTATTNILEEYGAIEEPVILAQISKALREFAEAADAYHLPVEDCAKKVEDFFAHAEVRDLRPVGGPLIHDCYRRLSAAMTAECLLAEGPAGFVNGVYVRELFKEANRLLVKSITNRDLLQKHLERANTFGGLVKNFVREWGERELLPGLPKRESLIKD